VRSSQRERWLRCRCGPDPNWPSSGRDCAGGSSRVPTWHHVDAAARCARPDLRGRYVRPAIFAAWPTSFNTMLLPMTVTTSSRRASTRSGNSVRATTRRTSPAPNPHALDQQRRSQPAPVATPPDQLTLARRTALWLWGAKARNGITTTVTPDAQGRPASVRDAAGRTLQLAYNGSGHWRA